MFLYLLRCDTTDSGKDLPPRFKKMFVGGAGGVEPRGDRNNLGSGGPGSSSAGGTLPSSGGGLLGPGSSVGVLGGGHDRDHGELSLRPTASMTLKPKTPALLPQSALSSTVSNI